MAPVPATHVQPGLFRSLIGHIGGLFGSGKKYVSKWRGVTRWPENYSNRPARKPGGKVMVELSR